MSIKPFDTEFDPGRNILHTVMRGQWSVSQVLQFEAATLSLLDNILRSRDNHRCNVLIDLTAHGLQSRETSEALQHAVNGMQERADRVAVDTSTSALVKLQVKRIGKAERIRIFESREEAEDWLL